MANRIVIQVTTQGAKQAANEVAGIGSAADVAAAALDALKKAAIFVGIGASVREILDLSDSFTNLKNRTAVFASSSLEAKQNLQGVLDIASRARAPLDETAQFFQRLQLAFAGTGVSQQELLTDTETVTKAIAISGTTAQEAAGGLRQLTQGISANRLSGQELNSVLKEIPVVARLIAKEMGVTVGQLRDLANKQGAITGDVIRAALLHGHEEIERQFALTAATFGQAFEVIKTAAVASVGAFNQATGASQALASAAVTVAQNFQKFLKDPENVRAVLEDLEAVMLGIAVAAIPAIIGAIESLTVATAAFLIANPWLLLAAAVASVVAALFKFRDVPFELFGKQITIEAVVVTAWKDLAAAVEALAKAWRALTGETGNKDASDIVSGMARMVQASNLKADIDKAAAELRRRGAAGPGTGSQEDVRVAQLKFGIGANSSQEPKGFLDRAADEKKALDDKKEEAAFFQKLSDQKEQLDKRNADSDKAAAAAVEALNSAQVKALKAFADLQATFDPAIKLAEQYAKATLTVNTAIKTGVITQEQGAAVLRKFNVEIQAQAALLEGVSPTYAKVRDAVNGITDAYAPGGKAAVDYTKKTRELNAAQILGVPIAGGYKAAQAEIRREYELALIAVPKVTAENNALHDSYRQMISELSHLNDFQLDAQHKVIELNNALAHGAITAEEYAKAFGLINTQLTNATSQNLDASVQGIDAVSNGLNASLQGIADKVGTTAQIISNGFTSAFSDAGNALEKFVKTGKFSFRDFASSIVGDITKVIEQLLLMQALKAFGIEAGGTGAGGGGDTVGAVLGIVKSVVGFFATGGPVSPGRPIMVGERGPEMFMPPTSGNIVPNDRLSGMGGSPNISIVNVTDPREIPKALGTRDGEQAIMNFVAKNRTQIRQLIS
jgi:lambda family phage tail tape measure protein